MAYKLGHSISIKANGSRKHEINSGRQEVARRGKQAVNVHFQPNCSRVLGEAGSGRRLVCEGLLGTHMYGGKKVSGTGVRKKVAYDAVIQRVQLNNEL